MPQISRCVRGPGRFADPRRIATEAPGTRGGALAVHATIGLANACAQGAVRPLAWCRPG
jgi:hypothetical protein